MHTYIDNAHIHTETYTDTQRQTDAHTRRNETHAYIQTETQTHTDTQKRTYRHTDTQVDRQEDTHTHKILKSLYSKFSFEYMFNNRGRFVIQK